MELRKRKRETKAPHAPHRETADGFEKEPVSSARKWMRSPLPAFSGSKNEAMYPYVSGIGLGLLATAALFTTSKFILPYDDGDAVSGSGCSIGTLSEGCSSSSSFLAHNSSLLPFLHVQASMSLPPGWLFWAAVGATFDAFALVFFSPLTVMRLWHNTVALSLACLWMFSLPLHIGSLHPILSLGLIGICTVITATFAVQFLAWFTPTAFAQQAHACRGTLLKAVRRGLFADNSTWFKAWRHFAIVFVVNWALYFLAPNYLVLLIGVLFEVSLNRYTFGQRTAKSDLTNVLAALIPFMEATCGSLLSQLGLDMAGEEGEDTSRVLTAVAGFLVSEAVGHLGHTFIVQAREAKPAKFMGSVFKLVVVAWWLFAGVSASNTCRAAFVGGNMYVVVADIATIWPHVFGV